MFEALDTSASGLLAQRIRMDTIAGNLAQMNTTLDANGKNNPYRRRFPIFASGQAGSPSKAGVRVAAIREDQGEFRKVIDWGDPHHDAEGYVRYPNVDVTTETVNAMECTRAYEANVTSMEATKTMFSSALRLIA